MNDGGDPRGQLAGLMDGFRVSACLVAVARLGIADALDEQPESTAAIAQAVGAEPAALRRLLRAVASLGVFRAAGQAADDDLWAHTPMSRALRADDPSALCDRAVALGTLAWAPWGALHHSVRTGAPAFDHVFGNPFFAHLQAHPDLAEVFGRTMTSFTRMTAQAVGEAHDFSAYRCVVDVGGGHGALLDVVLAAHPDLHAVLVDRPEVIDLAAPQLRDALRPRCTLLAADFFTQSLPHGDAIVLSWVLHDWDDETCVRLLQRCAASLDAAGEILIVEMVIPTAEPNAPSPAKMFDLEMLVQTGGRERTLAQYEALLRAAGLELCRHRSTRAPHSILVAARADATV